MAKGNGGTRTGGASNPIGLTPFNQYILQENALKSVLADERARVVNSIKGTKVNGETGKLINDYIDRASERMSSLLGSAESVNSISELNDYPQNLTREAAKVTWDLDNMARVMEANANDATGRRKKTYEMAASGLRSAIYEINSAVNGGMYGNKQFAELFEVFRSQNKWK